MNKNVFVIRSPANAFIKGVFDDNMTRNHHESKQILLDDLHLHAFYKLQRRALLRRLLDLHNKVLHHIFYHYSLKIFLSACHSLLSNM